MAQHYSDPKRASEPTALPDVETFYISQREVDSGATPIDATSPGWFYWFCFPGCLPDGEPSGPFATEAEALADAREGMCDDE